MKELFLTIKNAFNYEAHWRCTLTDPPLTAPGSLQRPPGATLQRRYSNHPLSAPSGRLRARSAPGPHGSGLCRRHRPGPAPRPAPSAAPAAPAGSGGHGGPGRGRRGAAGERQPARLPPLGGAAGDGARGGRRAARLHRRPGDLRYPAGGGGERRGRAGRGGGGGRARLRAAFLNPAHLIRSINDPEHPLTLEELNVVEQVRVKVRSPLRCAAVPRGSAGCRRRRRNLVVLL